MNSIATAQEVRQLLDRLVDSIWAFSAVVTAIELGLPETMNAPITAPEVTAKTGLTDDLATALLDVLGSLGLARVDDGRYMLAPGLATFVREAEWDDVPARLLSHHFQSREMVDAARRGRLRPGWSHTDVEILQAQGRMGKGSTRALAKQVFPQLLGLEERLRAPDAAFLDVGLGVGIISIELCRIYPNLRVIGLEPGETQAVEARKNIAAAGLEDRIEIRPQLVQELRDREAFDLAYLPQIFLPREVVEVALRRCYEALRPGGWILVVVVDAPGHDLHATTARLLNVLWGGSPLSAAEVVDLVHAAGFESVQVGGAPGSQVKGVTGRRPPIAGR